MTCLQLMAQKFDSLKELCDRKDNMIRQNNMVLELREGALLRCDEALKKNVALTSDDKDVIIVSFIYRVVSNV
jgi:hypothetical protein